MQSCTVLLRAVVVLWCSDSALVRWGNPEHSVSLSDTPVSTHDKQRTQTHTDTHSSVCQAQPSSRFFPHTRLPLSQSCKYISCLFFFCLGKMASGGVYMCVRLRTCVLSVLRNCGRTSPLCRWCLDIPVV